MHTLQLVDSNSLHSRNSKLCTPCIFRQVKSFFFLRRGDDEAAALSSADKQQYSRLLQLWQVQLGHRPRWASIMAAARRKNYDEVSRALAEMLE